MNFGELVKSSVLARALALFILAITAVCAIVIATVELLQGQAVNPVVWTIAGTALGTALSITNINFGVVLQPMPQPPAPAAEPKPAPAAPALAPVKEILPNDGSNNGSTSSPAA